MRESTAEDYNVESREVAFKVDIYFNGLSAEPLSVTRANYLMNLDLLDEACADSSTFIGSPSSNEVSFDLYSQDGLFNPANTTGAYHGKIKVGVPIRVYCKPVTDEEIEWDMLGEFFVTDWSSDITGITASVTAEDILYTLFNNAEVHLPIKRDYNTARFITDFFSVLHREVTIKGTFTQNLKYAFIDKENKKFIAEWAQGSLAFIYNNHQGHTVIQALDNVSSLDWTLTDDNQIISMKITQSVLVSHDGVSVTAKIPQLSVEKEVLQNKDQPIGVNELLHISNQVLTKAPLYALSHLECRSEADLQVTDVIATTHDITYTIRNNSAFETTLLIKFFGYVIEQIENVLSDDTDNMIKISNDYIQDIAYAQRIKDILTSYIRQNIPTLELEIRGNPKYQPGDKVRVFSENYGIDFTGFIIRQQFKYDGGLHSTLKLLNAAIFGG